MAGIAVAAYLHVVFKKVAKMEVYVIFEPLNRNGIKICGNDGKYAGGKEKHAGGKKNHRDRKKNTQAVETNPRKMKANR